MTWRRIGSFGSSGSMRLMKYGVMSTRNLSGADRPSRSSGVSLRICSISSRSLTRWLQLPAPVVPLLVGDVLQDRGAAADGGLAVRAERQGRVGEVDERGLGQRRAAASWWATAVLISWASNAGEPPGVGRDRRSRRIKSMQSASRRMIARGRPGGSSRRTYRGAGYGDAGGRGHVIPALSRSRDDQRERRVLLVRQVLLFATRNSVSVPRSWRTTSRRGAGGSWRSPPRRRLATRMRIAEPTSGSRRGGVAPRPSRPRPVPSSRPAAPGRHRPDPARRWRSTAAAACPASSRGSSGRSRRATTRPAADAPRRRARTCRPARRHRSRARTSRSPAWPAAGNVATAVPRPGCIVRSSWYMTQSRSPMPARERARASSETRMSVPGRVRVRAAEIDRRDAGLHRDLDAALPGDEPAAGIDPVAERRLPFAPSAWTP